MRIAGMKLTRRGEILVSILATVAFVLLMGVVGWLETAGL